MRNTVAWFNDEGETYRIPRLEEDSTWAGEFTHQTLTSGKAGDDAAASDALHNVLDVPGDEVTIVDDILLAFDEVFPDDSAEARNPQQADTRDLVDPEALA